MKKAITCLASILIYTLALSFHPAQAQEPSHGAGVNGEVKTSNSQFQITTLLAQDRRQKRAAFSLMPADKNAAGHETAFVNTSTTPIPNLPVFGNGSMGRLTKWTGFTSSSSAIGDSNIYEDKFGKVGIGTTVPTSLLTVQGVIETFGGLKFGDGTTQTTSAAGALFGVAHNATLQGNGTTTLPLGLAVPLSLNGSVDVGALLTATNSGAGLGLSGFSRDSMGVLGHSDTGVGVLGDSGGSLAGVRGLSVSGQGVLGISNSGDGVNGFSNAGVGVKGGGETGVHGTGAFNSVLDGGIGVVGLGGASAISVGGSGVEGSGGVGGLHGGPGVRGVGGPGISTTGGNGLFGIGGNGDGATHFGGAGILALKGAGIGGAAEGPAGSFFGDVNVTGKLTKTMGTFKIDHPLDPENKYLYHSFVESPDMMNIYNGNITTDENGDALVELPGYFDSLNKDFRYQLTVIGTFAQAIIASKVKGNRFAIKTNLPNVEVSWMVTGVRHDAYANKNRVQVEENKPERERGYYLHPEVFDQPEEKSIQWARDPEMMQRLKRQRVETESKLQNINED